MKSKRGEYENLVVVAIVGVVAIFIMFWSFYVLPNRPVSTPAEEGFELQENIAGQALAVLEEDEDRVILEKEELEMEISRIPKSRKKIMTGVYILRDDGDAVNNIKLCADPAGIDAVVSGSIKSTKMAGFAGLTTTGKEEDIVKYIEEIVYNEDMTRDNTANNYNSIMFDLKPEDTASCFSFDAKSYDVLSITVVRT